MSTPGFLGIAAPRSGSTWLHELLASHPHVYMPKRRKEISYFDRHYDRGKQWYVDFFPDETECRRYRAIGEITPNYLFYEPALQRIAEFQPPVTQLIMILRDPVDRLYSHYAHMKKVTGYRDTFESFLKSQINGIDQGFYFKHLQRFLKYYTANQVLILIYEESVNNITQARKALGHFLDIDPALFPPDAGQNRVNQSRVPRSLALSALTQKIVMTLRSLDLDWVVNSLKRTQLDRLYGERQLSPMNENTRAYLRSLYANDIRCLECYMDKELSAWK